MCEYCRNGVFFIENNNERAVSNINYHAAAQNCSKWSKNFLN
jgi:hypothetical protein